MINTENCDEFAAIQENEENIVEFGENSVKIVWISNIFILYINL